MWGRYLLYKFTRVEEVNPFVLLATTILLEDVVIKHNYVPLYAYPLCSVYIKFC